MSENRETLPWLQNGWRKDVVAWCAAQLAGHGVQINGAVEEVRMNAWSTVLRVPADRELYYFKACAPSMAAEVAVLPFLAERAPDMMPTVLATEPKRGWLLLRDGGDLLRPILRADRDLGHWRRILVGYAALQRSLVPACADLLRCGVSDRTLTMLPALYDELLTDAAALRIGEPDGLNEWEATRLQALSSRFAAECAALDAIGIPATIDHSDLHDGNILVRSGRYLLIDWGDACVGHPFMTLPVTLRSIAYHLELDASDPGLADLLDLYLAAWSDFGAMELLRRAYALAQRVCMVNRALTWRAALRDASPAMRAANGDAVPGWLQEYLASA